MASKISLLVFVCVLASVCYARGNGRHRHEDNVVSKESVASWSENDQQDMGSQNRKQQLWGQSQQQGGRSHQHSQQHGKRSSSEVRYNADYPGYTSSSEENGDFRREQAQIMEPQPHEHSRENTGYGRRVPNHVRPRLQEQNYKNEQVYL